MTLADANCLPNASNIGVEVRDDAALSSHQRKLLTLAHLDDLAPIEAWKVIGTNRQLAYSTHGVFRFFGKFPPPIARHLITNYSAPGDWILDPMMGSGTTAVEALILGRNVVARDISPLSTLLCRVKTTNVSLEDSFDAFARVKQRCTSKRGRLLPTPVGLKNAEHWFLPQTIESLGKLRAAIAPEDDLRLRELLLTAFISTVRRVSKATVQQGRLFLDLEKAKPDAWPTFAERFDKYATAVATLPTGKRIPKLHIEQLDAKIAAQSTRRFRLAIIHPPYFNNYKYSSINSLELAWLGFPPKDIRSDEIRESFKVGKPEKVKEYIEDLSSALIAIETQLDNGGSLALMMGDTMIRGKYINVTSRILHRMSERASTLKLEKVVLRVPQYTEASWVASQRRTGRDVGVTLNDFILLFSKKDKA